ncbi:acyltransferase [Methanosarcina sp.]|uniref:acyltransferase n=1 Tax=Methanosarcina sp. TaxID=2213 RepID=UPI002AB9CCFA|nr:acyltransferase [Methanosarcina sp.]MDY9926371.1 acyltransferase [Methanosarcina sp.]
MSQQKNRIEEIDYLRGFAILAVIAIHTSGNFTKISNINLLLIINVIIDVFSHFAVPLFIFISGFVLSLNYNIPLSKKLFYKKRAKSILPQYIIFSALYIVLNVVLSAINDGLTLPSITEIIFYLLTASSSYHLWYIALITQFYILYPYITKKYNEFADNNRTFYFISIILIIQQIWIIAKATTETYLNSIAYFNSIVYFNAIIHILLTRVFLSHVLYFVLGIYICQNYKSVKAKILKTKYWAILIVLIITLILSILWVKGIIEYGNYEKVPKEYFIVLDLIGSLYFPFIFLMLLVISYSFSNKKSKYSNLILLLGKYSFGIYLIHVFYIQIMVEIIYPCFSIDYNQWIFYPLLFGSTVLLSYLNVQQIARLPYSEIIIGINSDIRK